MQSFMLKVSNPFLNIKNSVLMDKPDGSAKQAINGRLVSSIFPPCYQHFITKIVINLPTQGSVQNLPIPRKKAMEAIIYRMKWKNSCMIDIKYGVLSVSASCLYFLPCTAATKTNQNQQFTKTKPFLQNDQQ